MTAPRQATLSRTKMTRRTHPWFLFLAVYGTGSIGVWICIFHKFSPLEGWRTSLHEFPSVAGRQLGPIRVPSAAVAASSSIHSTSGPLDRQPLSGGLRVVPRRPTIPGNLTATKIEFCRRCERTNTANNRTCVDEIMLSMTASREDMYHWPRLLRTILQVAQEHDVCARDCNPKLPSPYCPRLVTASHDLGLDQVSPVVLRSVSHTLPAIPKAALHERFNPMAKLANWTGTRGLYTYNPTILPYSNETYLVAFRISTYTRLPDADYRNLMGVAFLDMNLNILSNVVVDVNKHMGMGSRYGRRDNLGFVDFRLFALNGTYLLSDNFYALPLTIAVDNTDHSRTNTSIQLGFPLLYGRGIRVVPHGRVRKIENLRTGRNYQFLQLQDSIFIEDWPLPALVGDGGREIERLEFATSLQESPHYSATNQPQGMDRPLPALEGHELQFEKPPWKHSNNRGTACCVQLERRYYADLTANDTLLKFDYLLLGIAHVKSIKKLPMEGSDATYGYMSRFYTILPMIPPVNAAAQSGLFCWPPASITNTTRLLQWKSRTYNCPPITFASGIAVSLSDSSKLIVGYGIDDEITNMVEITKRDVAHRLFSPLPNLH
jgi:hypothetical protein